MCGGGSRLGLGVRAVNGQGIPTSLGRTFTVTAALLLFYETVGREGKKKYDLFGLYKRPRHPKPSPCC